MMKKKNQICSLRLTPDENHYDLPVAVVTGQILGSKVLESKVIKHGNLSFAKHVQKCFINEGEIHSNNKSSSRKKINDIHCVLAAGL